MRLLLLCVLMTSIVWGLPTGNPISASLHRRGIFTWCDEAEGPRCSRTCIQQTHLRALRYGYYGDFIFQKEMRIRTPAGSEEVIGGRLQPEGRVYKTRCATNGGHISLSFFNRVDLQAGCGSSTWFITTYGSTFGTQSFYPYRLPKIEIASSAATTWFAHSRWNVWSMGSLSIAVLGSYSTATPKINTVSITTTDPRIVYYQNEIRKNRWTSYQLGIGASWWMPFLGGGQSGIAPYCSIRYSSTRWNLQRHLMLYSQGHAAKYMSVLLVPIESVRSLGWSLGCTVLAYDSVSVTCEGRWRDEQGCYVETQIRF